MNAYPKCFDENNKYINLLVNDKEIWDKINSLIKKEFNSEPASNDKHIKTKIKIYNNRVYTNFRHNKIPNDNEYFAFLSVKLSDSIYVNSDKEYYLQILSDECKYAIKKF